MSRRNVTHDTAIEDIFGYSTGTRYGREVYVAGQLARDSDGNQIASTALSDKFARVAANIHKVLTKLEAESVALVYVQYWQEASLSMPATTLITSSMKP